MKHDFLQQSHQLSCETCLHERLHSRNDLFWVATFRQFSCDDLVDDFLAMLVTFI